MGTALEELDNLTTGSFQSHLEQLSNNIITVYLGVPKTKKKAPNKES